MSWSGAVDANLYEVTLDSVSKGTTNTTTFSIVNVADGVHSIAVRARDNSGNWSTYSSGAAVTVDRSAPSLPSVSAEGSDLGTYIYWPLNSDVVEYEVWRDGVRLGSSTAAFYWDRSATTEGTHVFKIRVKDTSGNWSDYSDDLAVIAYSKERDVSIGHAPTATKKVDGIDVPDTTLGSRIEEGQQNYRFTHASDEETGGDL